MKTIRTKLCLALLFLTLAATSLLAEPAMPGEIGHGGPTESEVLIFTMAIIIPFATVIAVCGMFFKARARRNELLHGTLRAMIEKGVSIPPELISPPQPVTQGKAKSDLRTGLVMLALGLGLLILLATLHVPAWPLGFIFLLIGGAFLLTWKLEKKDAAGNAEIAPK